MDIVHPDVDRYITLLAGPGDPILREMERLAEHRDFPIVGPQVGRLLHALAVTAGARRVLDLGSGFGYSGYWLAKAVGPTGTVVLTEGSGERAAEAREFLARGGLLERTRIEVGSALEIADQLQGPFDLIFNDIDKEDYPHALRTARALLRPGGLFVSDNMLWYGKVVEPEATHDPATRGVVELTRKLYAASDFATTLLPVRDGVTVSVRLVPEHAGS